MNPYLRIQKNHAINLRGFSFSEVKDIIIAYWILREVGRAEFSR